MNLKNGNLLKLRHRFAMLIAAMSILVSINSIASINSFPNDTTKQPFDFSFKLEQLQGIATNENEIRAGLLYDLDRNTIVWQKDMDYAYPIASLTKMMVGLLAFEDIEAGKVCVDDRITVTRTFRKKIRRRRYTTYSATEQYTLHDLLKMAMVGSHNESTVWIAKHCSGDLETFVTRMNERALQLGMTKTQYSNPSGLPAIIDELDNSASPRDLLVLGLEILKHKELMDITSIPYATVNNGKGTATYRNHNGLVINYNAEVDGIKTGFTKAAGFCLVSTATRGGHRMMSVVLGCRSPWIRNGLVANMLNTYFDAIKLGRLGESPVDPMPSQLFLDSVNRGLAMIQPLYEPKVKDSSDESYAYTYKTVIQKVKKSHTVRRGESLGKIADRYNVGLTDLKKWNKLKKNTIQAGQKLYVYSNVKKRIPVKLVVDPDESYADNQPSQDTDKDTETTFMSVHMNHGGDSSEIKVSTEISDSVQKTSEPDVIVKKKAPIAKTQPIKSSKPNFVYHLVQPGDTLWNIAQRYQAKVDQIKKANRISDSRSLKSGTRIKIPVGG
jgi:D-alanyl-D-alanine carboxypeptidase (penicillin-binding protein 5/6)